METLTNIFTSPTAIAVIWPIIYVLIQTFVIVVGSEKTTAKGDEKYKVWYLDKLATRPHSGPVTVNQIAELVDQGKKITDIARLEDSYWNNFSFGLDLSISAVATDFFVALALSIQASRYAALFIGFAVLHIFVFLGVAVILQSPDKPSAKAIWSANVLGIIAIVVPFIFFGGLLTT